MRNEPPVLANVRKVIEEGRSLTLLEARQHHKDLERFIDSEGRAHAGWVAVAKCCKLRLKDQIRALEERLRHICTDTSAGVTNANDADDSGSPADPEPSESFRSAA